MPDHVDRIKQNRDPGVKFTTSTRTVVLENHRSELRYYAGGWPSSQDRIVQEQFRIATEGYELGNFRTVQDGLRFAEQYLVAGLDLQGIGVPREVLSKRETTKQKV